MSNTTGSGVAIALFDFEARTKNELSFTKGDILVVQPMQEPGFLMGELKGVKGIIPEKYARIMEEAEVLFDSDDPDERRLKVKAGETIFIYFKDHKDWWKGIKKGKLGLIPATFVHLKGEPTWEAEVITSYQPEPNKQIPQLNVSKGDIIRVYKKNSAWWTGCIKGTSVFGIFPGNFVKEIGPRDHESSPQLHSHNPEDKKGDSFGENDQDSNEPRSPKVSWKAAKRTERKSVFEGVGTHTSTPIHIPESSSVLLPEVGSPRVPTLDTSCVELVSPRGPPPLLDVISSTGSSEQIPGRIAKLFANNANIEAKTTITKIPEKKPKKSSSSFKETKKKKSGSSFKEEKKSSSSFKEERANLDLQEPEGTQNYADIENLLTEWEHIIDSQSKVPVYCCLISTARRVW